MVSTKIRLRLYTLPDCQKCDVLKEWLKDNGLVFDEKDFDIDIQLDFIMRDMFGNPPILEIGEKVAPSEELFPQDSLDAEKIMEFLTNA